MKNLRFCLLSAHLDEDASQEEKRIGSMHPQKAMEEMGIKYIYAIPQSLGDQWWFFGCTGYPKELPCFLSEMGSESESIINRYFSAEAAEKIKKAFDENK